MSAGDSRWIGGLGTEVPPVVATMVEVTFSCGCGRGGLKMSGERPFAGCPSCGTIFRLRVVAEVERLVEYRPVPGTGRNLRLVEAE